MRRGRQEEDNTATDDDRSVFDMQSPENSGNWFGLFWGSGHISDCGRKPESPRAQRRVAAGVNTEEEKINQGVKRQICLWGI